MAVNAGRDTLEARRDTLNVIRQTLNAGALYHC